MSATTPLGNTVSNLSVFLNTVDVLMKKDTSFKKKSEALNKFIKSCRNQNLSQSEQSLSSVMQNVNLNELLKVYE